MHEQLINNLFTDLCVAVGQPAGKREEVRVWSMSGVERLTFPDGTTAIFKYAKRPFEREDRALRLARARDIPVPQVFASAAREECLGMFLEDLGPASREADDLDGAAAAAALHVAPRAGVLPVLDEVGLRKLPARASDHLRRLREAGRWGSTDDLADALTLLTAAAESRAAGAMLEPFGWVHSEFHPTSLHIGATGWRLLDFARAFTGPGLLDLASWHGTLDAPDLVRTRVFLETYAAEGGHSEAVADRGGLTAEAWALGWHRVWVIEWFMEQAVHWVNDPASDPAYIKVVRRHLNDAVRLLEP
ncbi:aminoglycoside phosphotransferase family protein [Streptomyces boninensis]|uniref:aminoglycoside phosphotransferase family protein n=1 Tax=Streptomyces boninensis TaxID=2039455 RepID=UPI003B2250C3